MSNTLDETLLGQGLSEYYSDERLSEMKQAILQWVADEVVGETLSYAAMDFDLIDSYDDAFEQGSHRTVIKQRAVLKQHGWKDGDVPPAE